MAAKKIFKNILNQVQASQLNYLISKTPFSANISLKCSFVQMHGQSFPEKVHHDGEATAKSEDIFDTSGPHENTEIEILEIMSKIVHLEETITKQELVIEDKARQVKASIKTAEGM